MSIGIQAPSLISVVVSLGLAVLSVICYFAISPGNMHLAFGMAILAYAVGALG